jgi:uncharacterized membrane protein
MADVFFTFLLILHIGSIVAWLGGATVFVSVVTPSMKKISSQARAEFVVSTLPMYLRFILGASGLAIVAGVLLYAYINDFALAFAPSAIGSRLIQSGAILGLIAFLIPVFVLAPTSRRLVVLAKKAQTGTSNASSASNSPPTEMAGMQRRMTLSSIIGIGLLLATLILMVVGATI